MFYRSHPILSRFLVWVVTPILLSGIGLYLFLLQSLPVEEGTVQLQGLNSSVEIIRDENAIPHIVAETDHDAFFAMGYVHAQDRMWQMSYYRRLGQGRMSEVLGRESLGVDQLMRTVGLYRAVEKDFDALEQSSKETLVAYAKGVNAWINEKHTLPLEFYLLNTKPEIWKPEDSLLLIKLSAYNLAFNFTGELNYDLLIKELGVAKANDLVPNVNPNFNSPTEIADLVDSKIGKGLIARDQLLQTEYGTSVEGIGSNAWAISGEHSESGKPILASDPHLATEIPSFWYMAEIQGDKLHVTGATFPGVPFVFIGHNQSIAWGTTNMLADSQDLFVLRTNPLNEDQYEIDGKWLDMEVTEEFIHVRTDFPESINFPIPPQKWQIRNTKFGPLISDVIGRVDSPLALKWTALADVDKSYQGFLKINYAQNWQDFKGAMRDYSAPAVNFIYADIEGNIGSFAGGRIPIRGYSDGRLPSPGWDSKYDWERYIPVEELPQSFNPEQGYVVNANNKNHPDDYPYIVANNWSIPYRADRISKTISEKISGGQKITTHDVVALQGNIQSLQAEEMIEFFKSLNPKSQEQKATLGKLIAWDGVLSEDSVEAAIYQVWLKYFNEQILQDDLKGDLLHMARGDELQGVVTLIQPKLIRKILFANDTTNHNWCDQLDTKPIETCEDIALLAIDLANLELNKSFGEIEWGDIHGTIFPHLAFTNMQFLSNFFERDIASGGGRFTVNNARWVYSEDGEYQQNVGPNYRQVLDLNDWANSGFINDTGQSGNVLSEHYDDNIVPHKQLKLWPTYFGSREAFREKSTLRLKPDNLRELSQ